MKNLATSQFTFTNFRRLMKHLINNQKGFTVLELMAVVWVLFILGLIGTAIYVAHHFLMKWW